MVLSAFFFVIVVGGVLVGGAVLQITRERSIARTAGMSQTTPVCGQCHYRLGGWTSPRCPECGVDVRSAGVRTGPRPPRLLLGLVIILLSLLVVGPAMAAATSWIFATRASETQGLVTSTELPEFHVSLAIDGDWRRFPPRARHEAELTLLAFDGSPVGGTWLNGRYVGSAPRRETTLRFDHRDGPPDELGAGVIDAAVREVLGADVDEVTLDAHARAVESLLRTTMATQARGELDARLLLTWADGPLVASGSGGHAGGRSTAWPGPVLTIVAVVATVWIGSLHLGRWRGKGWRRPETDEWRHQSGTDANVPSP